MTKFYLLSKFNYAKYKNYIYRFIIFPNGIIVDKYKLGNKNLELKQFINFNHKRNRIKYKKLFNSIINYGKRKKNKINKINKKKKIKKPFKVSYNTERYKGKTEKDVLRILNYCYTINKNVKQKAYKTYIYECNCGGYAEYCSRCYGTGYYEYTEVDYELRDRMYKQKEKIIKTAINTIKINKLNIKYGIKNGIIYFQYGNHQISFHDYHNKFSNIKKFKGEWIGYRNKKQPFAFIK